MNEKRKFEIRRAVETVIMVIVVFILAIALWMLLDAVIEAQDPYPVYPHVSWSRGSLPWYYYSPSYKVPALCRNYYGAHIPCVY